MMQKVEDLTGVFVRKQKLIFKGKVLAAGHILEEVKGMKDGSVLMLVAAAGQTTQVSRNCSMLTAPGDWPIRTFGAGNSMWLMMNRIDVPLTSCNCIRDKLLQLRKHHCMRRVQVFHKQPRFQPCWWLGRYNMACTCNFAAF